MSHSSAYLLEKVMTNIEKIKMLENVVGKLTNQNQQLPNQTWTVIGLIVTVVFGVSAFLILNKAKLKNY
ncbi:hypothetical protein [Facklamia sp. P12932]|uniref:hypothetical protein n=2 Tax=Facklamia TaxID=66831 RepID=UPI003D16FF7F